MCFKFVLHFLTRDGSPRTLSMPLVLSLLVDAGCCVGITASCDKDVGDAGVAELEEPVDRPGTTIGTLFCRAAFYSSAFFDELWFLTTGKMVGLSVIVAEFFRVKQRPVYLREASLSRINPIL